MATRSTNATEMRDLREQIQQIRNEFKELSAISKELAAERASHLTDRTKDLSTKPDWTSSRKSKMTLLIGCEQTR